MMTSFQQQRLMMNATAKVPPPQTISAPLPLLPPPCIPPSALPTNVPPPPLLPPVLPLGIPPPPMPPVPMNSIPNISMDTMPMAPKTESLLLMDEDLDAQDQYDTLMNEPPAPGTEEPEVEVDPANVPE